MRLASGTPCRRGTGTRSGDFAKILNKALRQRSQRAILYGDESDRRGWRDGFDWQDFEMHLPAAKAHDGCGDETKPMSRFDHAHVEMERHRQYCCRRRFKTAVSE